MPCKPNTQNVHRLIVAFKQAWLQRFCFVFHSALQPAVLSSGEHRSPRHALPNALFPGSTLTRFSAWRESLQLAFTCKMGSSETLTYLNTYPGARILYPEIHST